MSIDGNEILRPRATANWFDCVRYLKLENVKPKFSTICTWLLAGKPFCHMSASQVNSDLVTSRERTIALVIDLNSTGHRSIKLKGVTDPSDNARFEFSLFVPVPYNESDIDRFKHDMLRLSTKYEQYSVLFSDGHLVRGLTTSDGGTENEFGPASEFDYSAFKSAWAGMRGHCSYQFESGIFSGGNTLDRANFHWAGFWSDLGDARDFYNGYHNRLAEVTSPADKPRAS